MKFFYNLLLISLLSGCSTIKKINYSNELSFSKIIKYANENNCGKDTRPCEKGKLLFYINNDIVIVIHNIKGKITYYRDNNLIQWTDIKGLIRASYYSYSLSNNKMLREKQILGNKKIIDLIEELNAII